VLQRVHKSLEGNFVSKRQKLIAALRAEKVSSIAFIFIIAIALMFLTLTWVAALADSPDGVTTDSGARTAIIAICSTFIISLMFGRAEIWGPSCLKFVPIIGTGGFLLAAAALFASEKLDWAFALYGGFQVLRAEMLFSDMSWVLNWFECDFCERWDPHYGPTIAWLEPLSLGTIGNSFLLAASIALIVLGIGALLYLAKLSSPLGKWLIAVASISPAWLLLVDRANSDLIVFLCAVAGLWVVNRFPNLLTWALFASALWFVGTIKFYPFAIGITLLFALRIRHGWTIIAGFVVATALYMILAWESYLDSSRWTVRPDLFLGDFPYYSRTFIEDRITGGDPSTLVSLGVFVGLSLLLAAGAVIGFGVKTPQWNQHRQSLIGSLALAGGIAFSGKVLWAGFGFMYTGVFLLMIIPVLSVMADSRNRRNGIMLGMALFGVFALFAAYSTTLATMSGIIFSGFGLGFGLKALMCHITDQESQPDISARHQS